MALVPHVAPPFGCHLPPGATVERIAASDPFVQAGVATYRITTIDPGRVHPALAGLLGVDATRVRG